jgi:uncharacterized repeat protein (TIGR02543 family)
VEEKIVTNPGGREYPFQTVVELTPKPKDGWVFDSWSGDLTGTESPKNITVDMERNVIVRFKMKLITENKVFWWPFNGNADDESGNNNNGIIYGATLTNDRNGKENSAFLFDGINDVIDSKKTLEISVNFAISFWAKPYSLHQIDSESNNQSCCVYSGGSGQKYIMSPVHGEIAWGSNDHAGMGISMGKNGVSIYEHRAFHQPAVLVWVSPNEINDWINVVVNYIDNKSYLYINGIFVKEGKNSIQKYVHPSIGYPGDTKKEGIGGGLNQYFHGLIDDIAIYEQSLSAEKILKIFNDN